MTSPLKEKEMFMLVFIRIKQLKFTIMKRKYLNFIVETENEDAWETPWWRAAFCAYQRSKSCTIYGLPNCDGANYEVIMSK